MGEEEEGSVGGGVDAAEELRDGGCEAGWEEGEGEGQYMSRIMFDFMVLRVCWNGL